MIEFLAGTAGILGVLLVVAIVHAVSYRNERDMLAADLRDEISASRKMVELLDQRAAQIQTLQRTIDALREGHDRLVDERESFRRELGRLKAEKVAAKPKRGPNGRFISKSKATVTAIKCG